MANAGSVNAEATVAIDSLGQAGDQRTVIPAGSERSLSVTSVGDVNGDKLEDVAATFLDYGSGGPPDGVWVSFAERSLPQTTQVGSSEWRGFRITGGSHGLFPGSTGLGDVNGDGLGEVVVQGSNQVFVVFGRTDGETVDVRNLGRAGFRITNVSYGSAYGSGTTDGGSVYQNGALMSVGDQNADGRPDLAFRDGSAVKVAYSPGNRALTNSVNADSLGLGGYTLETNPLDAFALNDSFIAPIGDMNRDGRRDLVVAWGDHQAGIAHAVGVIAPGPGSFRLLTSVAQEGQGFELTAPNAQFESGITVGDQNEDGRRDVAMHIVPLDDPDRRLLLANSPEIGVERVINPMPPGAGHVIAHAYNPNTIDLGDQDEDVVGDFGFGAFAYLSSQGYENRPGIPADRSAPGGALFFDSGQIYTTTVADRNADGKPELVTAHRGVTERDELAWMVETFLSAPRPRALSVNPPAEAPGGVLFSGSFAVGAPGGSGRSLGSRTYVELTDRCASQKTLIEARDIVPVTSEVIDAEINVEASRYTFTRGRQYAFRLIVENGRGLAGESETQTFVYEGPDTTSNPCGEENLPLEQVGTAAADILEGTEGPDLLRGLGGEDFLSGEDGDDTLLGNAGADVLSGGPGLDELAGGSGRDRINALDGRSERVNCGKGKDRARLDPDDEARGCERDY